MQKFSKNRSGFTLLEMMIVMAIIAILALVTFANYRTASQQFALQRAVAKMSQDIRRVQAMAGQEWEGCESSSGQYPIDYQYSYGIFFERADDRPTSYTLYSDCNGNDKYDDGLSGEVEIIELEGNTEISNFSGEFLSPPGGTINNNQKLHIVFIPPDPDVKVINGGEKNNILSVSIEITNTITEQPKTLTIYKSGLIDY